MIAASFRDPAGRVFTRDGVLYRTVLEPGRAAYEWLMQSGLYEALTRDGLLIPHEDLGPSTEYPDAVTLLRPERVAIVTYPYEWSASQLRDAALATLRIQRRALEYGGWLKDASAFNIQFRQGRAVLIDTLSLEPVEGRYWPAYRQFCQHFYGPLLLARMDAALSRLHQLYVDGPPLALLSSLLPRSSWLSIGPLVHIHLHAASARRLSNPAGPGPRSKTSDPAAVRNMSALADSLRRAVERVRSKPKSHWTSYASECPSYREGGFRHKEVTVTRWLETLAPAVVWDLGANTGHFSRIAASLGARTLALDSDPACVETLVQELQRQPAGGDLLPIVYDMANPTPAIGWANEERMTLADRGSADVLLALAVVHHLAIGNNVPLPRIADQFARFGRHLIIEFVPKSDPMVQRMLASRRDVFADYDIEQFERAFGARYDIRERVPVTGSARTLYLMIGR